MGDDEEDYIEGEEVGDSLSYIEQSKKIARNLKKQNENLKHRILDCVNRKRVDGNKSKRPRISTKTTWTSRKCSNKYPPTKIRRFTILKCQPFQIQILINCLADTTPAHHRKRKRKAQRQVKRAKIRSGGTIFHI